MGNSNITLQCISFPCIWTDGGTLWEMESGYKKFKKLSCHVIFCNACNSWLFSIRCLTRLKWRSPSGQKMMPCSSMWTGHLKETEMDTVETSFGFFKQLSKAGRAGAVAEMRVYLQTCFWAHVRNTWGGSWSLPGPVYHIATAGFPESRQVGSAGQTGQSGMDRKIHNPTSVLAPSKIWKTNQVIWDLPQQCHKICRLIW